MTQRLDPDDFNRLFNRFRTDAFRLETRPVYVVDVEREAFGDFLRGEPRPATDYDYYRPWLDSVRAATSEGRRIGRVRILQQPPTDYQRFELWMARYNIAAGETLRCMSVNQAVHAGIPTDHDWWLFDSADLAVMHFNPAGVPLGGHIITDPHIVSQYCMWRDLAVTSSSPYEECPTA